VQLFATGDNHLALRTGEQVLDTQTQQRSGEFEYREFYLNAQLDLSTRKLRREPIKCADSSAALSAHIDDEWNTTTNQDFHFTAMLGDRELPGAEVAELDPLCSGEQLPQGRRPDDYDLRHLPYGQDLLSGGFGIRAKFTRFESASRWRVPQVHGDDAELKELKRHLFAQNTCSGCHVAETQSSSPFQIAPRLETRESKLSSFLRSSIDHPLRTTPLDGGKTYTYQEQSDRLTFLKDFAAGRDYGTTLERLLCNNSPDVVGSTCSATRYPGGFTVPYPP
jgi:hypothetical protein